MDQDAVNGPTWVARRFRSLPVERPRKRYANGGFIANPGVAHVGEQGPEIVVLRKGGWVLSSEQVEAAVAKMNRLLQ
jgi:hypothetical protein